MSDWPIRSELTATQLRDQLAIHEEIVHSTIEVHYLP